MLVRDNSILLEPAISYKESVADTTLGTVFTTFQFFLNLQMGAITQSIAYNYAKKGF